MAKIQNNCRAFRHHNWSQTRPNCCCDAPTCRAGRRRGWVYASCRMKNPLECHKPTRMPKMIPVFHASLAPRGYGRTSPRSPRVYLPFVANLRQLAVFRHCVCQVLKGLRSNPPHSSFLTPLPCSWNLTTRAGPSWPRAVPSLRSNHDALPGLLSGRGSYLPSTKRQNWQCNSADRLWVHGTHPGSVELHSQKIQIV